MEENQENNQNQVSQSAENNTDNSSAPKVGFPLSQPKAKGNSGKLIFIILGIVILLGGIIFMVARNKKTEKELVTPTPVFQELATFAPAPAATLSPSQKEEISIEVLNGTGITGEAAYFQGLLKSMGYKDIKVGNAESQDKDVTTVTFKKTLDSQIVEEITAKLKEVYKEVGIKTSDTLKVDVSVVTGLKKGQTPKPSPTVTPTPKATATPTASPTTTASPTASSTPTPQ